MLAELGVSTSGYYGWSHRKLSKQATHRKEVKKQIQTIYEDSKHIYGAPKITKLLQQKGECISERTVAFTCGKWGFVLVGSSIIPLRPRAVVWMPYWLTFCKNNLIRQDQTQSDAAILLIFGPLKDLCIWPVSWICFLEKSLPGIYPGSWMHLALLG